MGKVEHNFVGVSGSRSFPERLGIASTHAAYAFCERRPVESTVIAGFVHEGGLASAPKVPSGALLAVCDGDRGIRGLVLVSTVGVGFPVADDAAIDAMARLLTESPFVPSVIVGERTFVEALRPAYRRRGFVELMVRYQTRYEATRSTFTPVEPLELCHLAPKDLEPLAVASAAMAREEAGDDPESRNPALFRERLLERIHRRRDFGHFVDDSLLFKSNVAALSPLGGLIEGVFTRNDARQRGLAKRGTSTVATWILEVATRAVLLVNDDNTTAIRLYESLGFKAVSQSTTLYLMLP